MHKLRSKTLHQKIITQIHEMRILGDPCARTATTHINEKDLRKIESFHKELEAYYLN